ncbi:PREDICTED: RNA-binding protein 48 [Tarenaya hassleriana]|uniref:RNA-binding protein 48 n=1 Tax=Tarenaya hassleriana TaxID=28532 RepID=UPI00053C82D7|nr:PREDICTED: RNA-binding protein 48 [Tarenaya hassleriana]
MPRYKDEPPAIRVYTVCDESRYLIVRNVPSLGCGDDLMRLFATYGDIEEFKPMDAEECVEFTDVYWIKFRLISNARFAKRKLDESVFLGNRLQVSYAPEFESLDDTKDKLETRRKEVIARLNPQKAKGTPKVSEQVGPSLTHFDNFSRQGLPKQRTMAGESEYQSFTKNAPVARVSSNQDYFPSPSMNQTVHFVREKLNKIQETGDQKRVQTSNQYQQSEPVLKRARLDNRRRI